jgi:dCTP deaminase
VILPAQTIRQLCVQNRMITPFEMRTEVMLSDGTKATYGLGPAGYDIRLDQAVHLEPGQFHLASSMEHFEMPNDVIAQVCDKSSWARRGLAVQNTIIEPGWQGYLTIELTYHRTPTYPNEYIPTLWLPQGTPIAQIVFMRMEAPTEQPYAGKYQYQARGPQAAR